MKPSKEGCPKFQVCAAPLCPENPDGSGDRWYPDEEICKCHQDPFIKAQRKITAKAEDQAGYFTLAMLNKNCNIGKKIKGIDPDSRDEKRAITTWFSNHKSKKLLSQDELLKRADRMKSYHLSKRLNSESVTSEENADKAAFQ